MEKLDGGQGDGRVPAVGGVARCVEAWWSGRRCSRGFEGPEGAAIGEAVHRGHLVEDQHAVEMVGFVLPHPGGQGIGGKLERLAVEPRGPDGGADRAADLPADVGQAQATFLHGRDVA